ncbi:hypothetical protein [Janthinobacterium psychrotolerans]|uniref:Uncharacterized protein n=1 Tax=Janthinobacterium psychrotolerans TaxID=1747903 RepID=A0A1A7C6W1_9BURK|nr:hypothetical protein [Janthinobacterium psychrotolerans]OBV41646.1 hypothetical protein ASR47_10406 [Janthinobacterium psychrotolerans]
MIFKNSVLVHFKIPMAVAAGLPSLLKFRGMSEKKFFEIAAVKFFEELEEEKQEAVEMLESESKLAAQSLALDAALADARKQIRNSRGQQ